MEISESVKRRDMVLQLTERSIEANRKSDQGVIARPEAAAEVHAGDIGRRQPDRIESHGSPPCVYSAALPVRGGFRALNFGGEQQLTNRTELSGAS